MFKKTIESHLDMFASAAGQLRKREAKIYSDPHSWHNQFYEHVISLIDEEIFAPLFKNSGRGAPNVSVRVLVGMCILKESAGYSDENLFEQCQFNLLVRKSLGLKNISDPVPSLDTYYLFRRRIGEYERDKKINLIEHCFNQVTKGQLHKFKVPGQIIRMDSKLIGSNIADYSRFELVHRTLSLFSRDISQYGVLPVKLEFVLNEYLQEDPQKLNYTQSSQQIRERFVRLGEFIYQVLKRLKINSSSVLLHRVFHEQFLVEKGMVIPRANKDISAESTQNPHDPEATFRSKGKQQVKGYNTNIIETADNEPDTPNLIIGVQVRNASAADNNYYQEAVEIASQMLDHIPEEVYADGNYQHRDNRAFAEKEKFKAYFTGLRGKTPHYLLYTENEKEYVKDLRNSLLYEATRLKNGKWRIKLDEHYYYFSVEEVEMAMHRAEFLKWSADTLKRRNNVEATIFQYCYHTRNNKTRYRGMFKLKCYSFARCLWLNAVRLMNFVTNRTASIQMQPLFHKYLIQIGNQVSVFSFFYLSKLILYTNTKRVACC